MSTCLKKILKKYLLKSAGLEMIIFQKKPKVVFVRGDYSACSYYRMVLPHNVLKAKGWNVTIEPTDDDFKSADILILATTQRGSSTQY